MVERISDRNSISPDNRDVLRRLDRLKDEVAALRCRIEEIRPEDASARVHPERHRTEEPYCGDHRCLQG